MIKIAICDDEQIILDLLHKQLKQIFHTSGVETVFYQYKNGNILLNDFKSESFDILFLDIDMPKISGFKLAEQIRELSLRSYIIFVTSKPEFMHQSFDYQPFHFICKSDIQTLTADLNRIVKKLLKNFKQEKVLMINSVDGSVYVPVRDVVYIKSEKHYLLYHLIGAKPEEPPVKERGLISEKAEELSDFDFLRLHRQYIVNMNHIDKFDFLINTVLMSDKSHIPVSKSLRGEAAEKYRAFKRR